MTDDQLLASQFRPTSEPPQRRIRRIARANGHSARQRRKFRLVVAPAPLAQERGLASSALGSARLGEFRLTSAPAEAQLTRAVPAVTAVTPTSSATRALNGSLPPVQARVMAVQPAVPPAALLR